ncbi:immunoglobulin-like domain-containing protein [Butyricicoccus sp.]|uniref:immunoglobulin-like domain-containing protein n=1 Tax=Butyricicoccus sp. TaxID=2049021 RepID=UPI003735441E
MKRVKIAVLTLFVCSAAVFSVFTIRDFLETKDQPPVIEAEQDTISVPIDATEEQLCTGLHAMDAEDGDLTDGIIVTNISNFVGDSTCNISYAVFDTQEQLGTYTRKVTYTNYQSPKFTVSELLEVRMGGEVQILDKLSAEDVFDGDISNRILILSSTVNSSVAGLYDVTVQVSNSHGDVSELKLPVSVRDTSIAAPTITLTESLVYLSRGAVFDPMTYIDENESSVFPSYISAESTVNTAQPGNYVVTYSAQNKEGNVGHAYLTVVVEE